MNTDLFRRAEIVARPLFVFLEYTVNPERLFVTYDNGSSVTGRAHVGPVTDEILNDLIAYLTNSNPEELYMNIYSTDLFIYLAGDMLGQSTITLTVAGVSLENMNSGKGGAQNKPCLHFKERSKLMVLNKTNAKILAAELGPETDNWTGARVTIAAPVVDAFGKSARSLRVIKVEPAPVAAKPRSANGHTPAVSTVEQDDLFPAEVQPFVDPA